MTFTSALAPKFSHSHKTVSPATRGPELFENQNCVVISGSIKALKTTGGSRRMRSNVETDLVDILVSVLPFRMSSLDGFPRIVAIKMGFKSPGERFGGTAGETIVEEI